MVCLHAAPRDQLFANDGNLLDFALFILFTESLNSFKFGLSF